MNTRALATWAWPILVPPPTQDIALLTGDNWAPNVCAAIRSATKSVALAQYSLSAAWPKHTNDQCNVLKALIEAPTHARDCYAVLALHKPSAYTANFNRRAHSALEKAGWKIGRAPSARLLHAKVLVIDNEHVFIGSHNFSVANSASNIDLSIMLSGKETAAAFAAFIKTLKVTDGP